MSDAPTTACMCQCCGSIHHLKRQDAVKCAHCEHRIMYKLRASETVTVSAE
jgi:DNA-directed RNA polymerase subunit RPC12/RpoP